MCCRDYVLKGNMLEMYPAQLTVVIVTRTVSFITYSASNLMTTPLQSSCYCSCTGAVNPITVLFNNLSVTLVMEKCKKNCGAQKAQISI